MTRLRSFTLSIALATVLAGGLLSLTSCAHNPATPPSTITTSTITTPAGKIAYTVDQVLVRIQELQRAAIQAHTNGGLTTDQTRPIIQWTVNSAQILGSAPSGWNATLTTSWSVAKSTFPAQAKSNAAIASAIAAVDIVLSITSTSSEAKP